MMPKILPWCQRRRACGRTAESTGRQSHVLTAASVLIVGYFSWYVWRVNSLDYLLTTRRSDGELLYYYRLRIEREQKLEEAGIVIEDTLRTNRTPVRRGEFFVPTEATASVQQFFQIPVDALSTASLYNSTFNIRPLWTCSSILEKTTGTKDRNLYSSERLYPSGERRRKLVFLHMSRTAGSTIRGLLKAYASKCHANVAMVNRCVDLNHVTASSATSSEVWRNGRDSFTPGQSCFFTYVSNRTHNGVQYRTQDTENNVNPWWKLDGALSLARLQGLRLDILMGRLALGTDEYWVPPPPTSRRDDDTATTMTITAGATVNACYQPALYVAFFREPLHRFVSEVMALQQTDAATQSLDGAVQVVYDMARNALSKGRYMMHYSNYLITPRQKAWVEEHGIVWTPQQRLNLTLQNLANSKTKYTVLVGLVERMADSLELLRFAVDKDNQLRDMFNFFAADKNINKLANVVTRNRTMAIVQAIQNGDDSVSKTIEEYIQYDRIIYDFAVRLHEMQMQRLGET